MNKSKKNNLVVVAMVILQTCILPAHEQIDIPRMNPEVIFEAAMRPPGIVADTYYERAISSAAAKFREVLQMGREVTEGQFRHLITLMFRPSSFPEGCAGLVSELKSMFIELYTSMLSNVPNAFTLSQERVCELYSEFCEELIKYYVGLMTKASQIDLSRVEYVAMLCEKYRVDFDAPDAIDTVQLLLRSTDKIMELVKDRADTELKLAKNERKLVEIRLAFPGDQDSPSIAGFADGYYATTEPEDGEPALGPVPVNWNDWSTVASDTDDVDIEMIRNCLELLGFPLHDDNLDRLLEELKGYNNNLQTMSNPFTDLQAFHKLYSTYWEGKVAKAVTKAIYTLLQMDSDKIADLAAKSHEPVAGDINVSFETTLVPDGEIEPNVISRIGYEWMRILEIGAVDLKELIHTMFNPGREAYMNNTYGSSIKYLIKLFGAHCVSCICDSRRIYKPSFLGISDIRDGLKRAYAEFRAQRPGAGE